MVQTRKRNDAIRRLLPRAAVLALAAVALALVLAAVNADTRSSRAGAGTGAVLDSATQGAAPRARQPLRHQCAGMSAARPS